MPAGVRARPTERDREREPKFVHLLLAKNHPMRPTPRFRRNWVGTAALVMVLGMFATVGVARDDPGVADSRLPLPVDIPSVPARTQGISAPPGGAAGVAEKDETTPVIAAINQTAYPDDSLVITGWNLESAYLRIAVGQEVLEVQPLRSAPDRMVAVVPRQTADGRAVKPGTMLVWPVREGRVGVPIRVNGPVAWWAWPCRVDLARDPPQVRVFGKNLAVDGGTTTAMIAAENAEPLSVSVTQADEHEARVELPAGLTAQRYRLWVHNGTGGEEGWSEPVEFEVQRRPEIPTREFLVDDFGVTATDASDAIEAAVRAATEAGGGVVVFRPGRYVLRKVLELPPAPAIHLRGAGHQGVDPETFELRDRSTTLLDFQPAGKPAYVLRSRNHGGVLSDMALLLSTEPPGGFIELAGPDQTLRQVTVIRRTPAYQGLVHVTYRGASNLHILDSQFHQFDYGVRIEPGVAFVRIADCLFTGWYDRGIGADCNGVVNRGHQVLVERCRFRGRDRFAGRILSRSVLHYSSSVRHTVIADNLSEMTGPHPSVPGIDMNCGEQILYHCWNEALPPMIVREATADSVLVDGDLTQVPSGEGLWIVFIARGRGVGQWRVISGLDRASGRISLDQPWRLAPQPGSIAVVQPAIRHNLVLRNRIVSDNRLPVLGVAWWYNAFDNVTARNELEQCSGLYITASPSKASAWNSVHDNRWTGGKNSQFALHWARVPEEPWPITIQHWYAVGNQFRRNRGRVMDTFAAFESGWMKNVVGNPMTPPTPIDRDTGLAMSVFEHNQIEGSRAAVYLGPPSPWTLWRANRILGLHGAPSQVRLREPGWRPSYLLYEDPASP